MNATKFKSLLQLNRELSNTLYSLTDKEKATVKGGKVFTDLNRTDLEIANLVTTNATYRTIVEQGDY